MEKRWIKKNEKKEAEKREIRKEVEEDYGDPSFIGNKMRGILKKSQIKAGRN